MESFPRKPFGLAFVGRRFSEEKLIAYACAFEAATQVRSRGQQYFVCLALVYYWRPLADLWYTGTDHPDWKHYRCHPRHMRKEMRRV